MDTRAVDSDLPIDPQTLQRQLDAQREVNRVLVAQLNQRDQILNSSLSLAEQNRKLEGEVAAKTRELDAEREELRQVLAELKAAQTLLQQAQKMKSIGQLAAGMAHEINTPVQFISDNVRFVMRCFGPVVNAADCMQSLLAAMDAGTSTSECFAECRSMFKRLRFDYIKENVPAALEQSLEGLGRVATLVSAMKDFSHPSTCTKELVDIADVINVATRVARCEWKYVADLEIKIPPNFPPVPCLRNEIGQALLNLVVNASHAIADASQGKSGNAKGKITIEVREIDGFAQISVSDTGTGIPLEIRNQIFDPFFTTKPVGRGTGQGLAIAYSHVVDKHGGQITFESESGKGTTFHIRLPLKSGGTAPCA